MVAPSSGVTNIARVALELLDGMEKCVDAHQPLPLTAQQSESQTGAADCEGADVAVAVLPRLAIARSSRRPPPAAASL